MLFLKDVYYKSLFAMKNRSKVHNCKPRNDKFFNADKCECISSQKIKKIN